MTFIDYFAGIGGFTEGLKQAGMRCVGFCEADKWAIKSYAAMHEPEISESKEWFCGDITKAKSSEIPYADGWTAGFPCQDVSVCGKMEGLSGARSGLFFEFVRLLKGKSPENRPRCECGFALWKSNKFFESAKKDFTKEIATALINNGKTEVKGLYSAKTDKTYNATVCLDDTGTWVNFKLEFANKSNKKRR